MSKLLFVNIFFSSLVYVKFHILYFPLRYENLHR